MGWTILLFCLCSLTAADTSPFIGKDQSPLVPAADITSGASYNATTPGTYWLGQISHTGSKSIYDSSYQVYRNVWDFGAKGDGIHDDTKAIQDAISCKSSTGGLDRPL